MRVKVGALVMLMVLLGLAGGFTGPAARAADLSQIYPSMRNQYPGFIQQLQTAGGSQALTELESFVNVLSSDLAADQSLTRANFEVEAGVDCLLILEDNNGTTYADLHKAIAKAYPGWSLASMMQGNIPAALQPIISTVEDALLPAGTPTATPGPGGGTAAPQAAPTVAAGLSSISLTTENIGQYVSGGIAAVDFPAQATPPYFFGQSGGLLAANGVKGLDVDFGPLALQFGTDLVTDPSTTAEVTAGAVASTDGSLAAGVTSQRGLDLVGQVWNILFTSESNGPSQTLKPPGSVTLSLPLPSGAPQAAVALYVYDAGAGTWSGLTSRVSGGTLQAEISGSGEYALMAYTQSFTDVPAGYWAAGDISLMVARHIVAGEGDGSFRPDRPVTRAEFAVMLQRALGIAPSTEPSPFVDAAGAWYTGAVTALARTGIVTGDGGYFYPDREITREEMAVILVRALPQSGLPPGAPAPVFKDAADISGWAAGDVTEAAQLGLVDGEPGGLFSPQADATRAEAVVMVERLLRVEGKM